MPKYLVALAVGGLMECPEITYQDYQEIEADNEEDACKIYNEKNNCDYFYGAVIRKLNDNCEKKHIYEQNGTGVNGGIKELDTDIKTFVDNIYNTYNGYLDSDLELYILEEVVSRFCYKRIQCQIEHNKRSE